MSEPTDPNIRYEPKPYPRMLYATPTVDLIVNDEAEEAAGRAAGYMDFAELDTNADGLDVLSQDSLYSIALALVRDNLAKTSKDDLIAGIRAMRAKAAESAAAEQPPEPDAAANPDAEVATETPADGETVVSAPDYDAMDDDALRAALKARDGRSPHPATSREKLLLRLVEAAPESTAEPGA